MPDSVPSYPVYLLDPGPDRPAVTAFLREAQGLTAEEAAAALSSDRPVLIGSFQTRATAEDLVARLGEFAAVAVLRSTAPPPPPPSLDRDPLAGIPQTRRVLQRVLLCLGAVQIGAAIYWAVLGKYAAAFFGALLGIYVLLYFGRSREE